MAGRKPSLGSNDLGYSGLGSLEFDRPAPAKPQKYLRRASRSAAQHSQMQPQSQVLPQAPRSNSALRQQRLQREGYAGQPQADTYYRQQPYGGSGPPYEEPVSPSSRSDIAGGSRHASHPAGYSLASTQPGVAYNAQPGAAYGTQPGAMYTTQQGSVYSTQPQSQQVGYHPSAMVVGGGMPSQSRIMPSSMLVNAVASTEINRHQRERDLANALGRRRPTRESASSAGSAEYIPNSVVTEQPFNANASMDLGAGVAAAAAASTPSLHYGASALPQGRYMNHPSAAAAADLRVGRSTSSASSASGGYRGAGFGQSPYASQRRYAPPEQSHLRKQASTVSMGTHNNNNNGSNSAGSSAAHMQGAFGSGARHPQGAFGNGAGPGSVDLRHAHPASRSAPDLNMDVMKAAIDDVARNVAHNPVPQIPAAYSNAAPQNLSIRTDIPHRAGTASGSQTQQNTAASMQSSGTPAQGRTATSAQTPGKTAQSQQSRSATPAPISADADLVALLENAKPVYPAMLGLVAKAFYEVLSQVLRTRERNGLEHARCFTGRDAVDTIYAVIRASDRNLAIVVGRALEQQRLFHDVDYEKRLRDDANELYAFDDDVVAALMRDDSESVNGVFVMLTDCYSPTCSASQPCYSVTCPRQRAQQDHLRRTAKSNVAAEMKQERLWSMSVPKEIVKSISRTELDRQERLFEVFYGEKDYVRDLCILRDLYMKPLHNGDFVNLDRRKNFITKVFKNALAVLAENMELHRALEQRQKENFVCYSIGDVFLPFVEEGLETYLEYCANQPYSLHFLDAEKRSNSRLVDFLDRTDRRPECRKLGVQHFLTRPPTRLARYPLMLKAVLKKTPEGHPDRETIPYVIERIEAMLERINVETGKAQNRLRLFRVDEKLMCSVADRNDLRLTDDQRRLVRDSQLRKRGDGSMIQVLLLDHMLLMCRVKADEKYTLYKRPVPLQMLTICIPDDPNSTRPRMAARRESTGQTSATIAPSIASAPAAVGPAGSGAGPAAPATRPTIISIENDSLKDKYAYPLQITYLGRNGFTTTLYAAKQADRKQWYECIEQQQLDLMERHRKFELVPVARQFPPGIRVTTADVYDQGRGVVIGTDHGLYLGASGRPTSFQRLTHLKHDRVFQVEIHEGLNVMAMIADKDRNLYVYPLDHLMTATSSSRHGLRVKPLHTHVSFFRFGHYQDQDILCAVRSTTLSNQTIIHVYKPVMTQPKSRTLGRFLSLSADSGLADSWKCIKECYIAAESTSLHFLRSRLCVGCTRGFEIVDLATMNTQSLLDPADTSLGFINKRETTHPIALFRVQDGEFLLCYDVFAFYVNRNGQRARSNWMIHWVGTPTSFKFEYPYILAFDSQFIEVYHVETGSVIQVIITGNCASLTPNKMHVNLCVTSQSPTHPQEVLRIQHILAKDPL
ncbi:RHO1 GDP-GTP exchange protein 2 [Coemansia sp. RSA 552]|nr:RHO1 GDP-GTP exchange protein 2 [Coemansia sp. RSA 552]